jgi:flagellar biosynthesis protein FliQ
MDFLFKAGIIAMTAGIYAILWNIYPPRDLLSLVVWVFVFLPALPAAFIASMVVLALLFGVPVAILKGATSLQRMRNETKGHNHY